MGWLLDWHGVMQQGETLFGPPPETLGPAVDKERFRAAVMSQLREMRELARRNNVAYVPAQQGYIVATVSRALYTLATGRSNVQGERDRVGWPPDVPISADFLRSSYAAYRADVRGPHERLIAFVDEAVGSVRTRTAQRAGRLTSAFSRSHKPSGFVFLVVATNVGLKLCAFQRLIAVVEAARRL